MWHLRERLFPDVGETKFRIAVILASARLRQLAASADYPDN